MCFEYQTKLFFCSKDVKTRFIDDLVSELQQYIGASVLLTCLQIHLQTTRVVDRVWHREEVTGTCQGEREGGGNVGRGYNR